MPLETDDLRQPAVLWSSNNYDNDGEPKVDAADSIFVRWEDSQGVVQDGQGDNVTFNAEVFVSVAIPMESVLYQGTLAAFEADSSPELYRVVGTKSIPDLKAVNSRRSVLLARLSSELPEIVS